MLKSDLVQTDKHSIIILLRRKIIGYKTPNEMMNIELKFVA